MTALAAALPTAGPLATIGPDFLDAEHLISQFGAYALGGIVLVVFIETGLLFPFLPGDSLLFTAGMLVAQDEITVPLWVLCLALFAAAFVGDQLAYFIGHKVGPRLFNRPDSRIFKQEYIDQTYAYFDKYGGRTIIVARFVPFVRTYAPVVAGVARMRYRTFVSFNVVGALLWGVGVTVLGYFLGQIEFVRTNIEIILILIVGLSLVPVAIELLRARSRRRDPRYDEPHERERVEAERLEAERVEAEEVDG
ncbi:DedA family protein [uncultured Cellulomonas sp.]|uniref:DedA family protein n=1 Tax=uncultured Cellulomonas sp. TaxID=189682 RepID=UPI0026140C47|nr:VTT domain-containing protein [uncultured Cellulomonas sp.]